MARMLGRYSLLLFAVAIATCLPFPPVVHAQSQAPGFHSCISLYETPGNVLDGPLAINLWRDGDHQTIGTCARFCSDGSAPTSAEFSGNRSAFAPPYAYGLFQANWCFCGNTITGNAVPATQCQQQVETCLQNPGARCMRPGQEGFLVFATAGVGQGGQTPQPAPAPPPPPPPSANRPPFPPTVPPGAYEPPVVVPYGGGVQLAWRDNGDPDGDALTFGLFVMLLDQASGTWIPAPSFRDAGGNPQAIWMNSTSYNYSTQAGLQSGAYYSWGVIACEVGRTAEQPCAWSGWSVFRTQ